MNEKKRIQFTDAANEPSTENTTPWKRAKHSSFKDWILKPEYAARRLTFRPGQTWIRILPPLQGSPHGWMLGIHALEFAEGRFAHPRTLKRNAKSAYDHAYAWAVAEAPQSLYSKTNKAGVRLLANPYAAFWVAVEEEGRMVVRIFLGSAYDGSRGGSPGLGWHFWHLSQEKDEEGNLIADLSHPECGVLVSVEKTQAAGAKYPSYRLRRGRQPARADDMIARMEPEELDALVPLEDVVRVLTPEEEWQCLGTVLSPETVAKIRLTI